MAAVGVTNFASQLVLWVPLLGILTGLLAPMTGLVLMAAAWGIMMAFNLVTLPVEFDASHRAKHLLNEMGFIQAGSERAAVAQVLNAAAWTYVAAFITSLLHFLWYLLPLLSGRDRE
jgi:Zn-dependent membrane protease YugP